MGRTWRPRSDPATHKAKGPRYLNKSFGSSSPKVESLHSAREYEDWLDSRCREIENNSSLYATYTDLNGENIPSGQEPSDINQNNPDCTTHIQENQGKEDVSCLENQGKADIRTQESPGTTAIYPQKNQGKSDITRTLETQGKSNCNTHLHNTNAHLFLVKREHSGVPIPEKTVDTNICQGLQDNVNHCR